MDKCPQCGSNRVHRSRTRSFAEKVRRQFSMKRLHRCHACGWRGWAIETVKPADQRDVRVSDAPPPDLHAIEKALAAAPSEPKAQAKS